MIYLFDLDDTLADTSHRQHFLEQSQKDWDGFNAACGSDTVKNPVAHVFRTLVEQAGDMVFILTGRSEDAREATELWLCDNYLLPSRIATGPAPFNRMSGLLMRDSGDRRDDRIVKREMFDHIFEGCDYLAEQRKCGLIAVFDDRQKVVDMWRSMGLTCFQVEPNQH